MGSAGLTEYEPWYAALYSGASVWLISTDMVVVVEEGGRVVLGVNKRGR